MTSKTRRNFGPHWHMICIFILNVCLNCGVSEFVWLSTFSANISHNESIRACILFSSWRLWWQCKCIFFQCNLPQKGRKRLDQLERLVEAVVEITEMELVCLIWPCNGKTNQTEISQRKCLLPFLLFLYSYIYNDFGQHNKNYGTNRHIFFVTFYIILFIYFARIGTHSHVHMHVRIIKRQYMHLLSTKFED